MAADRSMESMDNTRQRDTKRQRNEQEQQEENEEQEEEEEEHEELEEMRRKRKKSKKNTLLNASACPFLHSIQRRCLDFTSNPVLCSKTLSPCRVYLCLVCGKYFSGKAKKTPAYAHSVEEDHAMFMSMEDKMDLVWMPQGETVHDRSIDDIRFNADPKYSVSQIEDMRAWKGWKRALDGTEYMPGFVPLGGGQRSNHYYKPVLQVLNMIPELRMALMPLPTEAASAHESPQAQVARKLGDLMRRCWNDRAFKTHVTPYELMRVVGAASRDAFTSETKGDPVAFLQFMLNTVEMGLKHIRATFRKKNAKKQMHGGVEGKNGTGDAAAARATAETATTSALPPTPMSETESAIAEACAAVSHFRGALELTQLDAEDMTPRVVPYMTLALDLPRNPLYKDEREKNAIPQVPLLSLLRKYDGSTVHDTPRHGRRLFSLLKDRLPKYLVLTVTRFEKKTFFTEKNRTIVNFPIAGLDVCGETYTLLASIRHQGDVNKGGYAVHARRFAEKTWYDMDGLHVREVLPQQVALGEATILVYTRAGKQQQQQQQLDEGAHAMKR